MSELSSNSAGRSERRPTGQSIAAGQVDSNSPTGGLRQHLLYTGQLSTSAGRSPRCRQTGSTPSWPGVADGRASQRRCLGDGSRRVRFKRPEAVDLLAMPRPVRRDIRCFARRFPSAPSVAAPATSAAGREAGYRSSPVHFDAPIVVKGSFDISAGCPAGQGWATPERRAGHRPWRSLAEAVTVVLERRAGRSQSGQPRGGVSRLSGQAAARSDLSGEAGGGRPCG